MPATDYAKLTDEELEAAAHALQATIHAAGEELQALADIRNERGAKARSEALLSGMAPGDLDVLIEAAVAKLEAGAAAPVADEDES